MDYNTAIQLKGVIGLASGGRVLKEHSPELSGKCIKAAKKAFKYFKDNKEAYRSTIYFKYDEKNKGRDQMVLAAATELYLTTEKKEYLDYIRDMSDKIEILDMNWPSPFMTGVLDFWYAPPFLARLYLKITDRELKKIIEAACQKAANNYVSYYQPEPWALHTWNFYDWGNNDVVLYRVFDVYWISKVIPDKIDMDRVSRTMLWLFGLHPLNNYTFICDIGYPGPKYLYNGRLFGQYGMEPASVPGAVVPGIGGQSGTLVYIDKHGYYRWNEACIYTQAGFIFAVHAMISLGY